MLSLCGRSYGHTCHGGSLRGHTLQNVHERRTLASQPGTYTNSKRTNKQNLNFYARSGQTNESRISYSFSRLALGSVIEKLKKSKLIAGDDKKQRQPVHICYGGLHQFGGHFGGESNLWLRSRLVDGD